jgi:hypothetical protein
MFVRCSPFTHEDLESYRREVHKCSVGNQVVGMPQGHHAADGDSPQSDLFQNVVGIDADIAFQPQDDQEQRYID